MAVLTRALEDSVSRAGSNNTKTTVDKSELIVSFLRELSDSSESISEVLIFVQVRIAT